jgi:hypothetical protein
MEFLGIRLDSPRNEQNAPIISRAAGPFTVRVMNTNEELMIRPTHPPSHALLGKELFMKSTEESGRCNFGMRL